MINIVIYHYVDNPSQSGSKMITPESLQLKRSRYLRLAACDYPLIGVPVAP